MTTKYRPIPETFVHGGFTLTKLKRDGDVALYEQRAPSGSKRYETVVIRRREASEVFGKPVSAREAYPGSSDWGSCGWTSVDRASGELQFAAVVSVRDRP
jgi:hypothetical protein